MYARRMVDIRTAALNPLKEISSTSDAQSSVGFVVMDLASFTRRSMTCMDEGGVEPEDSSTSTAVTQNCLKTLLKSIRLYLSLSSLLVLLICWWSSSIAMHSSSISSASFWSM